jgi:hypothetical protein
MIYLYLKIHNITGLKYLGKTVKDPFVYRGSGTVWKRHISKYGNDVSTKVLFKSSDLVEFSKKSLKYSNRLDVVNNPTFANLIHENGLDGGSKTTGKTVYNNGSINAFYIEGNEPSGWVVGRCDSHNFTSVAQSAKSRQADPILRGSRIQEAWANGKFDNRDTTNNAFIINNPSSTPEGKAKISRSVIVDGVLYNSHKAAATAHNVTAGCITHWKSTGKAISG